MNSGFYFTVFYQPIYNLLVFFIDSFPGGSVGAAVIITTVLVKLVLFPLTKKALISQMKQQEIQPKIEAVRAKHKGNREAEGRAIMEVYKEAKLNPFAGIFSLLIQLPIIFALFFIFARSGLPEIRAEVLYSFVDVPSVVSMVFLGFFHLAEKSWILAILAGAAQFVQAQLSIPPSANTPPAGNKPSFGSDFAKSMNFQVKYVLPIFIIFVAHSLFSAVALYFLVSNLFSIGQELALRRHRKAFREANANINI